MINGKNDDEEIMDLDAELETKTEFMVQSISKTRPKFLELGQELKSRDLQKRKTSRNITKTS